MRIKGIAAIAVAGAMVLAGCGSDDETSTNDDRTEESTPQESDFKAPEAADFELDEPVKIVAIISDAGEDPNAVPDFNDATRMAIAEINAAGGIGGHDVEFESVVTPPYGDITDSLNEALDKNPTALLGPVSSTTLLTISEQIDESNVPVVHFTTVDDNVVLDGPNGSEWMFALRPYSAALARFSAYYAADELGAETAANLYLNAAFGKDSAESARSAFESRGGTIEVEEAYENDQTDFSKEIQKTKDVDVVFDWGTPVTTGAMAVGFAQQGLADLPRMGAASIAFSFFYQNIEDPSLLDNIEGVVDCNPLDDDRDHVKDWADRYENEFGYLPSYAGAQAYDAVYILREVIESAEDASPEAIRDGLMDLSYSDGVCAQEYSNDGGNTLFDEATVIGFEDGMPVNIKHYDAINHED